MTDASDGHLQVTGQLQPTVGEAGHQAAAGAQAIHTGDRAVARKCAADTVGGDQQIASDVFNLCAGAVGLQRHAGIAGQHRPGRLALATGWDPHDMEDAADAGPSDAQLPLDGGGQA